jgi:hypothetical protein
LLRRQPEFIRTSTSTLLYYAKILPKITKP